MIKGEEYLMRIKWQKILFIAASVFVLFLAGCAQDNAGSQKDSDNDEVLVVTSFTLIEDIVKQIGGDVITTHNLVPIGTDPHEYEPLPEDTKAITDASGIIYNGFNLEGGDNGWLMKMIDTTGKDDSQLYELME